MSSSTTPDPSTRTQSESAAPRGGLPAKSPRPQADQTNRARTPEDAAVETSLELPHERDEAADMTANVPDPQIEQAAKDVAQGLSDTSKATELDATYRKLGK
jgi:hypothetical protein